MGTHPQLKVIQNVKHRSEFDSCLKCIEKDLMSEGCSEFGLQVVKGGKPRSFFGQLFLGGPKFDEAEETMEIGATVHAHAVEVLIPIAQVGVILPYLITVLFPVALDGRAEYRHHMLGNRWHFEPENDLRCKQLSRLLPHTNLQQQEVKGPYLLRTEISVGQWLVAQSNDQTNWTIMSACEGRGYTGKRRPDIREYLKAIPNLWELLQEWNRTG